MWAKTCYPKRTYFFQDRDQFSEKLEKRLIYRAKRLQKSWNQWRWWLIGRDPSFDEFKWGILQLFLREEL